MLHDADTYSLFNLSLEDLEFGLEFVDELGESLSVLLVLLDLEFDLLDAAFGLAPVLVGILVASENLQNLQKIAEHFWVSLNTSVRHRVPVRDCEF